VIVLQPLAGAVAAFAQDGAVAAVAQVADGAVWGKSSLIDNDQRFAFAERHLRIIRFFRNT
jgi:hypothetical protein